MRLIKFGADWCAPCKAIEPHLEAVGEEMDVLIERVDIDEDPATAQAYNVRSIPTIIVVEEDGTEIARVSGMQRKSDIIALLN